MKYSLNNYSLLRAYIREGDTNFAFVWFRFFFFLRHSQFSKRIIIIVRVVRRLIIRFLLQPTARISSQVESSNFVVNEYGDHERNRWQPPFESTASTKQSLSSQRTSVESFDF